MAASMEYQQVGYTASPDPAMQDTGNWIIVVSRTNRGMSNKKTTDWGDIAFVIVTVAVFVGAVYLLQWLGLLAPTELADRIILGGALLTLGMSAVFNMYSSDGHSYHRLGFELCGMTLGTCLSLLVAQMLSGEAVLPRLGHSALGIALDHSQQVALVSLLGFTSVFGLGITAKIVRAVDGDNPPPYPNGLSFLSFCFGLVILLGYVWVLLGAGA